LRTISVIIPTLNEAGAIAATLASAGEADEVIVVDGGSEDATQDIVRNSGQRLVQGPRGRGLQLNAGAAVARGDILLFLHADTELPAGFRALVDAAMSRAGADWGRFDLRFDDGGPLLRLIAHLISIRSRISRVATGDQAIFVSRRLFLSLGGFHEAQLFEDVELCRRLKGTARMAVPAARVTTSARRWRDGGTIRVSCLMWALKLAYLCGVPAERLAAFYRAVR
jgi:rSAM/selenodomain-associated transferase 2